MNNAVFANQKQRQGKTKSDYMDWANKISAHWKFKGTLSPFEMTDIVAKLADGVKVVQADQDNAKKGYKKDVQDVYGGLNDVMNAAIDQVDRNFASSINMVPNIQ